MKNVTFLLFLPAIFSTNLLHAQDYPPNPKPGMCYIRCVTELRDEISQQEMVPSYKEYKVVPAQYKTVEEKVLVKPSSKRFEYVPAVYKDVTDSVLIEEPIHKITVVPVKMIDTVSEIVIQPEFARFESRPGLENCKSKDPRDCEVICYVVYKEIKKEIPVKKIVATPAISKDVQKAKYKTIKKKELVTAATVREIEIPAEYVTIQKRVLVKDETLDSVAIGAVYREEPRLVRDESDGVRKSKYEWKEIDCKLTEPNILPIFYDLNSAVLSQEARTIVYEKLFKLMVEKPFIKIEINSHTDSRASDDFNIDLSQRRAQAVLDYLVSKGIKKDRMMAHGFGETQPVNHCTNGVECTEEQHAKNRRTEFRVLPN